MIQAVTRTQESQYSQYSSSVTPHPPESPQEINLAKIPNFIIEFIPLTSPAKIEKINQIYKQWALKSNRHLFQLMFKVLEQSDIYGIWSIKV